MQTSPKGIVFLEAHEGVVLKAYRCPAGRWTIGTGITSAAGVGKVTAGMTITRERASQLLATALRRNYEPRVAKAMPKAKAHEFDGGVSFDFNTGAIDRAGWVKLWLKNATKKAIRASLGQWRKGGGKVLPGLVRRRAEEADLILDNKWPAHLKIASTAKPSVAYAVFVIAMSVDEIVEVRRAFAKLGYAPGAREGAVRLEAVTTFQRKHDLTVDGKIGRATLSTLQRELDARSKGAATIVTGGGATVATGGNEAAAPDPTALDSSLIGDPWLTTIGVLVIGCAALYGCWLAWQYRDVIAARVQGSAPRFAKWLRSF
jgi:lysozyme